jgi:hypothetical protein
MGTSRAATTVELAKARFSPRISSLLCAAPGPAASRVKRANAPSVSGPGAFAGLAPTRQLAVQRRHGCAPSQSPRSSEPLAAGSVLTRVFDGLLSIRTTNGARSAMLLPTHPGLCGSASAPTWEAPRAQQLASEGGRRSGCDWHDCFGPLCGSPPQAGHLSMRAFYWAKVAEFNRRWSTNRGPALTGRFHALGTSARRGSIESRQRLTVAV